MLLAVYGTLRRGDSNDGFLRGYSVLSTERVEGFEMYNLGGSYPYIAKGADDITVEVYDISPDTLAPIERMERGAGYDMAMCKTTLGMAEIFCMTEEAHANLQSGSRGVPPKIVSGDWFTWLKRYAPHRLAVNVFETRGKAVLTEELEGDGHAI